MEFLRSLLRRRFARAQVATSRDVGCFSGYARRPRRIFPPSPSGDVTFDISSRTTGNEAEDSSVSHLVVLALK